MKHRFISKRYWNSISTPMGESNELLNMFDDIINFSLGDPDFDTPEPIIDLAMKDAKNGHTHYTDAFGDPELRDEIRKYYKDEFGLEVKREEIMVTTSGGHAMWLALEAILDDGDEVIIPAPHYTPYPQQVELTRGKPVFLPTYEEEMFQVNVDRLEKLITNRTKALIINTPNNPTGTCYKRKTMEDIARIAQKYDLIVISDDVYSEFSFEEPFIPIVSIDGMKERTITVFSFSKNFAMTGWRIGYILAPDYIIKTVKDINENNVFSAPSISQRAALYALRMRKEICPPLANEIKNRMLYAYDRINRIPKLSCLPPRGSMYLFVNIKETGLSSTEFCDLLLKEAHIIAIPGIAFGSIGEGYIRLALTIGIPEMKEAFDRIEKLSVLNS
jgi:aspartate/methionine/tyrosine aminotransferase